MSDLFRWEDGGGLKHHCPICQTPLSHEKCRTQCLGVHVEWCRRYHTLFRKNWSSRCSACKTTDEQHEKRHREIAELIAKINKLKAEEDEAGAESSRSRTLLTASALNSVDGISNETTPRTTKKERKKLKKAAKAMGRDKVVTSADILFVANTLHPEGEQKDEDKDLEFAELTEDEDIKMNLKFNNSTCNTKTARYDFIKKDRGLDLEGSKIHVGTMLATFEVNTKANGQEGKLVAELTAAIRNDLVHYHDELRTTAKLRSAFWRWANARAYRELVGNGKDWDDHAPSSQERTDSVADQPALDNAAAIESDEEAKTNRNYSVDSGMDAASASTSLTVPSVVASPVGKPKVKTLSIVTPKAEDTVDDGGWKQVGSKVLKAPAVGKLKMIRNGGLHHFARTPKGTFGALADGWGGAFDEDRKPL
ncbi:uncharacterized protein RCC_01347 [Ramularia collo-cygni]|uniref:Uncharacterized protein n=1 Tax=Ramularia collo-cygni TaxID=112498 RepID=A0A2D3UZ86_9PEZI|nr:uncharacterized protein RCC_01347 [Ramularia collo-cygni]CZT15494.1 uncharacterized protein RCC_01347 [Ramularia collo-cygni]